MAWLGPSTKKMEQHRPVTDKLLGTMEILFIVWLSFQNNEQRIATWMKFPPQAQKIFREAISRCHLCSTDYEHLCTGSYIWLMRMERKVVASMSIRYVASTQMTPSRQQPRVTSQNPLLGIEASEMSNLTKTLERTSFVCMEPSSTYKNFDECIIFF